MKTSNDNLLRLAGLAALLAGICYVFVGLFHPANVASAVTTTRWQVVHVLACAMCFFGLLGMAGLYARQAVKTGWLGLAGYLLLSLWLTIVMGFSFVEAFILPHVASAVPTFVQSWMGMFNGPAGTFDLGILPTIWTSTAPMYIGGGLLFGIATFRAGILPRWAGALLALSVALAPVAALLPNAAQPKIAVPFGMALAWLGFALLSERRTEGVVAVLPPQGRAPEGCGVMSQRGGIRHIRVGNDHDH
ncbi:hypothetical protein [Actinopolymorpha pittospori]|uniref:DUF4386 family protein n=1 Tax=Actinopolymorpha pittospori TaxID=648752 RepID=A0A927R5R7_9ACTN|nr:hypothetical protein [Actinopolymorpha pittospori]MBE1603602.1 hypothetical protein [Actinopolymorpha pittospori]